MTDTVSANSNELPEVLKTLADLLPQFTGADLEAQLQTYDTFLDMGCDRTKIADLLRDAAKKTIDKKARTRIEWAANNVRMCGRAAAPYDHAEAMAEYVKNFKASYAKPDAPVTPPAPAAPVDANADVFTLPQEKREHPKLVKKLDEIEAEMRRLGYWADGPAVEFDPHSRTAPDAPTFELWLQRVFFPRARSAVANDLLPKNSNLGVMAMKQYDYMDCVPEAHPLMVLLSQFDELVELASVGGA